MDSDHHEGLYEGDQHRGLSRREVMRRGVVIGGAAAWAAPTVQTIGMRTAFAATGTPRGCTGFAYDLSIVASGLVSGDAGPVRQSDKDEHHPEDCFSNVSVGLDGHPNLVTARTFCVENEFQNSPCDTRAEWENATVDVRSLIDGAPVLTASVLRATAEAECNREPQADSHIAELTLGGETVTVTGEPNQTVSTSDLLGGLLDPLVEVTLVLNEQYDVPGGIAVNAVRFEVVLLDALGNDPVQTVQVILSHAEADEHPC